MLMNSVKKKKKINNGFKTKLISIVILHFFEWCERKLFRLYD